jgi:hypothetical protein
MRGGVSCDVSPANNAPIPACASATLSYENCNIKPGSQTLSTARLSTGVRLAGGRDNSPRHGFKPRQPYNPAHDPEKSQRSMCSPILRSLRMIVNDDGF